MADSILIGLPPAEGDKGSDINKISLPPEIPVEPDMMPPKNRPPIQMPAISKEADWDTFSRESNIDDAKAKDYADSVILNLSHDIPVNETLRNKKSIELALSHNPTAARKVESARKTYHAISALGAGWQYDARINPNAKFQPDEYFSPEQIKAFAKTYRKLGLIKEDELQKTLASANLSFRHLSSWSICRTGPGTEDPVRLRFRRCSRRRRPTAS